MAQSLRQAHAKSRTSEQTAPRTSESDVEQTTLMGPTREWGLLSSARKPRASGQAEAAWTALRHCARSSSSTLLIHTARRMRASDVSTGDATSVSMGGSLNDACTSRVSNRSLSAR